MESVIRSFQIDIVEWLYCLKCWMLCPKIIIRNQWWKTKISRFWTGFGQVKSKKNPWVSNWKAPNVLNFCFYSKSSYEWSRVCFPACLTRCTWPFNEKRPFVYKNISKVCSMIYAILFNAIVRVGFPASLWSLIMCQILFPLIFRNI